MPTVLDKQILEEGPRNAVVKLTGVVQDGDVHLAPAIALSDFSNNDIKMTLVGLRVDAIMYSMGQVLDAVLSWKANTPQQIAPLAKSGKIDVTGDGGFLPDQLRSGYDGGINLDTSNFSPGTTQNYTILLRLVKLYKV